MSITVTSREENAVFLLNNFAVSPSFEMCRYMHVIRLSLQLKIDC